MRFHSFGLRPRLFAIGTLGVGFSLMIGLFSVDAIHTSDQGIDGLTRLTEVLQSNGDTDMMHDKILGDVNLVIMSESAEDLEAFEQELRDDASFMRESATNSLALLTEDDGDLYVAAKQAKEDVFAYTESALYVLEQKDAGADKEQLYKDREDVSVRFDQLEESLGNFSDMIVESSHTLVDNSRNGLASARTTLMITMGLGSLIVIGLTVLVIRSIVSPIRKTIHTVTRFAQGDLRERLEDIGGAEFAQLREAINTMGDDLSSVISEVRTNAQEVAGAATQIAASSEQLMQGASNQSFQTQQVAAAVEQASSSLRESSEMMSESSSKSSQAGEQAKKGAEVVNETVQGMNSIIEVVDACAEVIGELGRKGEKISEIVNVINDIADQTNLLALNAAIEAARAGEHGRGFAVVADEVRKLAERTTSATDEVSSSIREIQDGTSQAVQRMNDAQERGASGIGLAQQAGEMLQSIVRGASEVQRSLESINAAGNEQSNAMVEISDNIQQINEISNQTTRGVEEATSAASELSQKSEHLLALTERFRV
ncbi:MAG: methyl-accepting chemotaxis protein [Phycisphaerales bacterium]